MYSYQLVVRKILKNIYRKYFDEVQQNVCYHFPIISNYLYSNYIYIYIYIYEAVSILPVFNCVQVQRYAILPLAKHYQRLWTILQIICFIMRNTRNTIITNIWFESSSPLFNVHTRIRQA